MEDAEVPGDGRRLVNRMLKQCERGKTRSGTPSIRIRTDEFNCASILDRPYR